MFCYEWVLFTDLHSCPKSEELVCVSKSVVLLLLYLGQNLGHLHNCSRILSKLGFVHTYDSEETNGFAKKSFLVGCKTEFLLVFANAFWHVTGLHAKNGRFTAWTLHRSTLHQPTPPSPPTHTNHASNVKAPSY